MKNIFNTVLSLIALVVLSSCGDKSQPQIQYMPDMYNSVPYEPYASNDLNVDGKSAKKPVVGTIARGHELYDYPNTNEGYELAKAELKSPLNAYEINSKKGEQLFGIYCTSCHGKKGDGQGTLVKREKFLGVPNYKDRDITDGSIYHVLMHGKNMMGSHASLLTIEERWQVVHHVQKLRNELIK